MVESVLFLALTEEILKKSPNLHIENFGNQLIAKIVPNFWVAFLTNRYISTDVLFKGLLLFSRSAVYLSYLRT